MPTLRRYVRVLVLTGIFAISSNAFAASGKTVRIGYLEHPGSGLLLLASVDRLFEDQGVRAILVKYRDSRKGLTDLVGGKIHAGVFAIDATLQRIAAGTNIRIISGGGTVQTADLIADLDEIATQEQTGKGVVLVVADHSGILGKDLQVRLVTALIEAYRELQNDPVSAWGKVEKKFSLSAGEATIHFDPNPDYWRLEQLWRSLGLQREWMRRDFLAGQVNEEIYCDALDELLDKDGRKDPLLLRLSSRAVCVPDCCPTKSKNKTATKEGLL